MLDTCLFQRRGRSEHSGQAASGPCKRSCRALADADARTVIALTTGCQLGRVPSIAVLMASPRPGVSRTLIGLRQPREPRAASEQRRLSLEGGRGRPLSQWHKPFANLANQN